MGQKQAKQQEYQYQYQNSSSKDKNYYQTNVRAYAQWDHGVPLTSNDVSRVALQETQNFEKQKRAQYTPAYPQEKNITAPYSNSSVERKKPRYDIPKSGYDENTPKPKPKPRYDETTPKPTPRYDENIQKPKLGMRKSRSTGNLVDTNNVIKGQHLLYDKDKRKRRNKSPSSQIPRYSSQSSNLEKSTSSTSINQLSTLKNKRKKIPDDSTFVTINARDLQNAREIGKGNFGTVYHAIYKGTTDVAIKTLHGQNEKASDVDYNKSMHELLHEANIMTHLKHANLLRIIGVTFFGDRQRLSLVTDFMKNGSLLDYLTKNREIFLKSDSRTVTRKINSFARQIFEAMSYLEERRVIHRDLAARNCLIGKNDTLKVGDFGLTKLTDCGSYKGTDQSICAPRWTAPEAIFSKKYSSRSDVWSYGITLWEIYSLGEKPFGNISNYAVQVVLKNSSENLSRYLPQPRQFGSDKTYTHIILPCLTYNAAIRPLFKDLRERLVTILVEGS